MTEPRGNGAGPWVMAGLALAVPTTALVIVMARYWSPLLNFAIVGGFIAVALQLVKVLAPLHWHSTQNRMQRDDARTIEVQARSQPPALTDGARADLYMAQAAHVRAQAEAARMGSAAAERPPVPVRVWTDGLEDDGGYDDGEP